MISKDFDGHSVRFEDRFLVDFCWLMHFLIDYNYRSKVHQLRRLVLHVLVTREAQFWWSFASRLSAEYLFNVICLTLNPSTAGSTFESLLISRSFSPID